MRIRVVVSEMPGLLKDIVSEALRADEGIDVVTVPQGMDVVAAVVRHHVDVAVMGLNEGELDDINDRLFEANPMIKVLGVGGDGKRVSLYELRPVRQPLGEVSPEELVSVVKDIGGPIRHRRPETVDGTVTHRRSISEHKSL